MEQIFTELTVWHWLALGLVLFGIEMLTGTFDLMMLAVAAWLTAAFAFLGPDSYTTWQGQLIVFGVAAFRSARAGRRTPNPQRAHGQPGRPAWDGHG